MLELKELIERVSLKAAGRSVGLEVQMVDGRLEFTPMDPDDPRYSTDFILPSMKMVDACRADDFDFFQPFIDAGRLTVEQMHRAAARYHLGKTRSGLPMFWMIDDRLDVQDAHIGADGWISSLLKSRQPLIRHWRPVHCFFGLHLISEGLLRTKSNYLPIAILESEASAVVLSELFPQVLWMAYATVEHLDVALIRRRYDLHITVATILEDHATLAQKERCIDLLDYLLTSSSC